MQSYPNVIPMLHDISQPPLDETEKQGLSTSCMFGKFVSLVFVNQHPLSRKFED